jgi:uncharacterized alpha/beta hydrolase family protein
VREDVKGSLLCSRIFIASLNQYCILISFVDTYSSSRVVAKFVEDVCHARKRIWHHLNIHFMSQYEVSRQGNIMKHQCYPTLQVLLLCYYNEVVNLNLIFKASLTMGFVRQPTKKELNIML